MYKYIMLDQCGYLPQMKKQVTFCSDRPVSFSVLRSDSTPVYTAKAEDRTENASAGEINYVGDFSQVTEPGKYYILADGLGESDTFVIGENVFAEVYQKAMSFFFLQRCGQDLSEEEAGLYAHRACHTQIGRMYGGDGTKEVTGGWHDAGDYGRYVVPGAMTVAQLLYALERNEALCGIYKSPKKVGFQRACADPQVCLESSDEGVRDFLEELQYELDWMMKMQREDGALYHKATCERFCSFIMPEEETEELILSPVSVTATADFAAVCAMAVRFYKKYDETYAAKLEEVSRKAYQALKKMELPGGFKNPEGIFTGEYGDGCDADERCWAAAELYKAFGDGEYRSDFEALAGDRIYHGYGWDDMGSYANLAYLSAGRPVDEKLKEAIRKDMIALADGLLQKSESDGYGVALKSYVWGSNMNVANNGLHLYDAWVLTGERRYLDAAASQLHYLLGRNPMGLCYVTGCGTDAVKHPHHRPSGIQGKAVPGMLSGGPCDWIADELMRRMFGKEHAPAPAKCMLDMTGSYSTNEVTIYWNSSLIQLLASVMV